MTKCPDDLRRLYRERRIIPFVGAGASMSVSWKIGSETKRAPSWSELVAQATKLLGSEDPSLLRARGGDLQILEYFCVSQGDPAPLTNWMSRELGSASDEDIVRSPIMAGLATLENCRTFYTTNYDDFIERALIVHGRKVHVVARELNVEYDPAATEVVKFHGDFNSPNQMVISETHYLERMRLESPMDFKLRSDMLGRALLFVGYSFKDPNVNYIFHLVKRILQGLPHSYTGRRAYIILPEPSEFERLLFNERNIEVIAVNRDALDENIAVVLQDMQE